MEFLGKLDLVLELQGIRGEHLRAFRRSSLNKGRKRKHIVSLVRSIIKIIMVRRIHSLCLLTGRSTVAEITKSINTII